MSEIVETFFIRARFHAYWHCEVARRSARDSTRGAAICLNSRQRFWGGRRVRILATIIALPLAACGIGSQVDARNEYQRSTDNYQQCLAANRGAPQQCEALRVAMEAAGRKYQEVAPDWLDSAKIRPGEPPPGYGDAQ
jgi:hypothetical protein